MTSPADWRAQRYAAKSAAWLAGYRAFSPSTPWPGVCGEDATDWLLGWYAAELDYDEARDRAREDRQHYPASPLSALERNRP